MGDDTKRQRFLRRARLLSSREFKHVFQDARRSASSYFTVLTRHNELGWARLGLVISKKCEKTSVGRNRIKRLIRERYRVSQHALTGLDIIVIGRPGINKIKNCDLITALDRHWKKLAR